MNLSLFNDLRRKVVWTSLICQYICLPKEHIRV